MVLPGQLGGRVGRRRHFFFAAPRHANVRRAGPSYIRTKDAAVPAAARAILLKLLRAAAPLIAPRRPAAPQRQDGGGLRILVQSTGGFGNTLMATPLLHALRERFPKAAIHLLTTPGAAQLLEHTPGPDAVIPEAPPGIGPYLRQIRRLRRERYTHALLALNTVALRHGIRPFLAGVPIRVMHRAPFRPEDDINPLQSHLLDRKPGAHDAEDNLALMTPLDPNPAHAGPMRLQLAPEHHAAARAAFEEHGIDPGGELLALCPGCRAWARDKRWPLPNFRDAVLTLLQERKQLRIVALCGPEENEEAEYLRANVRHPRFVLLQGLPLPVFAAAIAACGRLFSNDSLPVHIASALRIPVAALYGPTDPRRVGPWQCPAEIVAAPCGYAPYFTIPYPPDMAADDPCMGMIAVPDALAAVRRILDNGSRPQPDAPAGGRAGTPPSGPRPPNAESESDS